MKLKEIKIRGFRSIKDQTISFENKCQILVGVNESGKTNILKALQLIDPDHPPTARDRRRPLETEPPTGPQNIAFEFEMSDEETVKFQETVLGQFLVKNPDTTPFCIMSENPLTLREYVLLHKTPLVWITLVNLTRSVTGYQYSAKKYSDGWYLRPDELVGLSIKISEEKSVPIESFRFIYAPDFPEIPLDQLKPIGLTAASDICAKELAALLTPNIPKCVFWTYKDAYLLPSSIPLNQFAEDPNICIPLQQMFYMAEYTNIKKAIEEHRSLGTNALRNLLERVAKRATKHVRQIWKEYKNLDIKLEINGDSIDASVIDHFNRYDFADRSDGFKRFISFLLVLSAQARTEKLKNNLILIDEAEIGLHPSGVKYLRDELIKIAENNHVVVSTHSIFMIDRDKIERHLIVRKNNETTEVQRVDHTNIVEEEVVFNALNYSVFESLKPINFVFEGWRDKTLFEVALSRTEEFTEEQNLKFKSIGRCHLQGVNDAGRVVPILELANRGYFVISDSDKAAAEAKKKFKGSGDWLMYSDLGANNKVILTSEDFLTASAFKPALSEISKHYGVEALKLTDDPERNPRVPSIRAWLQGTCSLEGDGLKSAVDSIKESVFTELKKSHIFPEYFDVLRKLCEKLPE